MTAWHSLRGRLAGAMIVVFLLAVLASGLADRVALPRSPAAGRVLSIDIEPYQDALVLAAFSLPALVAIWLVSSWSLAPIARASAEARLVGPQSASARLSREGLPTELVPLVDAVNSALERLADAMESERRFTENAAHELRTPLAVLGLRLQRARSGGSPDWAEIDADLARMNRLVAQLMDLARKDHAGRAGTGQARQTVNLARIARETCVMMLPVIEAQGRSLSAELPDSLPVAGSAADLHDALRNLLENALQHGKGQIAVTASLTTARDEACLIVGDEGPGVPEAARDRVFGRFETALGSGGSGLGLAIVREVARSHGGKVAFLPGAPCRIALTLPKRRPGALPLDPAGGCPPRPALF